MVRACHGKSGLVPGLPQGGSFMGLLRGSLIALGLVGPAALALIAIGVVVSCASEPDGQVQAPTLAPASTSIPDPTAIPTPSPTATPRPPEPTATPSPPPTATATVAPAATATPRPTSTPAPVPTPLAIATPTAPPPLANSNRGWFYFDPDCPDAYDNCSPSGSEDLHAMALPPSTFTSTGPDEPYISIVCNYLDPHPGPWFLFDAGGAQIGLGSTFLFVSLIREGQGGSGTPFTPRTSSSDQEDIWLNSLNSRAITLTLLRAEGLGRDVRIRVSGELDAVTADFDVTGFETNFERLPCS